jgi:hypothetical protein
MRAEDGAALMRRNNTSRVPFEALNDDLLDIHDAHGAANRAARSRTISKCQSHKETKAAAFAEGDAMAASLRQNSIS